MFVIYVPAIGFYRGEGSVSASGHSDRIEDAAKYHKVDEAIQTIRDDYGDRWVGVAVHRLVETKTVTYSDGGPVE